MRAGREAVGVGLVLSPRWESARLGMENTLPDKVDGSIRLWTLQMDWS